MLSDSDTGYVYTLSDPRTGDPRYVGATVNPRQRYHTHVTSPHSSGLAAWVRELAEQDMTPDMNIVQIDEVDGLAAAERRVLKRVASEHDVLNTDMNPSYPGRGSSTSTAETTRMAKTRALLTETEREQIAGEHGRDRRYQATSRVRSRIKEELSKDVEVLAEHHPDLLEELREVVCEGGGDAESD